jgi:hypothetical protein
MMSFRFQSLSLKSPVTYWLSSVTRFSFLVRGFFDGVVQDGFSPILKISMIQ